LLHPCEPRQYALTEEVRLRVMDNRLMRRIFWPKREVVTYEEQHDWYRSQNIRALITGGLVNERCIKRAWKKREIAKHYGL